ncbi:hypothetical protein MAP00_002091 [Monascus purpureus]|nr:hypothetical protein MAP00_002091 [Monascus purpureus]
MKLFTLVIITLTTMAASVASGPVDPRTQSFAERRNPLLQERHNFCGQACWEDADCDGKCSTCDINKTMLCVEPKKKDNKAEPGLGES